MVRDFCQVKMQNILLQLTDGYNYANFKNRYLTIKPWKRRIIMKLSLRRFVNIILFFICSVWWLHGYFNAPNAALSFQYATLVYEIEEFQRYIIFKERMDELTRWWNLNKENLNKVNKYWPVFKQAAEKHNIDPFILTAIAFTESGFDSKKISSAGAKGLTQLMDETCEDMGVADPFDPEQNIKGCAKYLACLRTFYNNIDYAIYAYYKGPGYLDEQIIIDDDFNPSEHIYVQKIRIAEIYFRERG